MNLKEATNLAADYISGLGTLLGCKDVGEHYAFSWNYAEAEATDEPSVGNDPILVDKETGECSIALIPALIADKKKRGLLDALLEEGGWQPIEGL